MADYSRLTGGRFRTDEGYEPVEDWADDSPVHTDEEKEDIRLDDEALEQERLERLIDASLERKFRNDCDDDCVYALDEDGGDDPLPHDLNPTWSDRSNFEPGNPHSGELNKELYTGGTNKHDATSHGKNFAGIGVTHNMAASRARNEARQFKVRQQVGSAFTSLLYSTHPIQAAHWKNIGIEGNIDNITSKLETLQCFCPECGSYVDGEYNPVIPSRDITVFAEGQLNELLSQKSKVHLYLLTRGGIVNRKQNATQAALVSKAIASLGDVAVKGTAATVVEAAGALPLLPIFIGIHALVQAEYDLTGRGIRAYEINRVAQIHEAVLLHRRYQSRDCMLSVPGMVYVSLVAHTANIFNVKGKAMRAINPKGHYITPWHYSLCVSECRWLYECSASSAWKKGRLHPGVNAKKTFFRHIAAQLRLEYTTQGRATVRPDGELPVHEGPVSTLIHADGVPPEMEIHAGDEVTYHRSSIDVHAREKDYEIVERAARKTFTDDSEYEEFKAMLWTELMGTETASAGITGFAGAAAASQRMEVDDADTGPGFRNSPDMRSWPRIVTPYPGDEVYMKDRRTVDAKNRFHTDFKKVHNGFDEWISELHIAPPDLNDERR
jgi:hypothetical protein